MKKISALLLAVFLFSVSPASSLGATGTYFSIASETLPPLPDGAQAPALLLRLKQQAVRDYLQKLMGPRFERYSNQVTADFAEKYILDYQVPRQSPDSSQMEIAGHLDTVALREWIRTNETKATGSSALKPLFLISANVPGLALDPRQTGFQVKQNPIAQTVYQRVNDAFQKFNANLSTSQDSSLALTLPPTKEAELRALQGYGNSGGFNCAVWVDISVCKNCGTRFSISLFNLPNARQVQTFSADVGAPVGELSDPKKLTKELGKMLQDFSAGFEESISKGTLFALEYRVVIEGIDTYKTFKQIDSQLPKQDFVIQSSVSRSTKSTAEFKVLSSSYPRDFYQNLQSAQFAGMTLRPTSLDGQVVTLRYMK